MNILYICHEYPPAKHGGIGSFVKMMADKLTTNGHKVFVIGLCSESNLQGINNEEGVYVERLLRLKPFPLSWKLDRKRIEKRVKSIIKQYNIDIVEGTDYETDNATWGKLTAPYVMRLHGSQIYFAKELGRTYKNNVLMLEKKAFTKTEYICSVSKYTAEKTQLALGINFNYKVIYNPIENQDVDIDSKQNHVIFTGTLTSKKGVIQLIKAWKEVLKKEPKSMLHIYGKDGKTDDGNQSMQHYLQSLLIDSESKQVTFHGHISRSNLLDRLKESLIAVYPSYAEAFAIAPLEAMACGCATIYTTRGSGVELINDSINGFLVDPDDVNKLATTIINLLNNPEQAKQVGTKGREHVNANFSDDKLLQENIEFYQNCIKSFKR